MLVKELIEELHKVDPNLEVRLLSTLGGFQRIKKVRPASTGETMSKYDWESGIDAEPVFLIH